MKRHRCEPRADWKGRVEEVGLTYHSHDEGPYWDESACYEFTPAEVNMLEATANTLHQLCLEAAGAVVHHGWWDRLGIPASAVDGVRASWERDDRSLYGRFDLIYDGTGPPKLLEYNADTPTTLVEAAVAQWFWLREVHPGADQFNSIHERLIQAWGAWAGETIHFSSIKGHAEDSQTVLYLQDTCTQAGVRACPVHVEDIGWDARAFRFLDLESRPIRHAFKLYPWEWMHAEEFGPHLRHESVGWIEPAWKMLLSSKGLLPVLWELFPGHPNLLPCYRSPEALGSTYIRKPLLSREGANVTWVEDGAVVLDTPGDYGSEGHVYQAIARSPDHDGNRPVLGLWIVDHAAAGMGIREDQSRVTGNLSRFVPHFFS